MGTSPILQGIKHVHLVGIGGAGMGGIAEVLLGKGYHVSGSDRTENAMTQHLRQLGANVSLGHRAEHVNGAEVVVFSSAVATDNPELVMAQRKGLPLWPRAQMLAALMEQAPCGIAIAGTHGKTTTTGLIASILTTAGCDPTFVIGGLLVSANTHAQLGKGHYFVAEADESDASFLYLQPHIAVVTNIDADHLNHYRDFAHLQQTFVEFLHRLPADGLAVLCSDDAVLTNLLPQIERPVWTYGFKAGDHVRCLDFQQQGTRCQMLVQIKGYDEIFSINLNLPGRHNVLNALAAIAVASRCGVADQALLAALAQFAGTGRRLQNQGALTVADKSVLLLDDYGHHPREIAATLEAVRQAWPDRRLVLAFQPHRYSRTQALFQAFVDVLTGADVLLLLDIYPASEPPLPGVSSQHLYEAAQRQGKNQALLVGALTELPKLLPTVLQPNDVLLLQGAGDISRLVSQLVQQWGATTALPEKVAKQAR